MSNLRITLIQSELLWEQPQANREAFSEKVSDLQGKTDLIVLPEMFTTGFSMHASDLAESWPGPTMEWMAGMAEKTGAAITGSLISEERGNYYNRLIWMRPDGTHYHYDKRHLFAYAGEDEPFTAGNRRLLVRLGDWRICPLICYDLRFPVWSRNGDPAYDVLLYVANWPLPRRAAWDTLLEARAIENQAYVVGVNRVGTDGNDAVYNGGSVCVDYQGKVLYRAGEGESIHTVEINREELQFFRTRLPFLADADPFQLLR